ncbi:MAG: SpoIIE family protein phosphatase [Candidatus Coproplasma sp.]
MVIKKKRKFTRSLIRPIFNALIGLIMLLSFAIGTVGYFEFSTAIKEQYAEMANGIAQYVALEIDASKLDGYLESKTVDEQYSTVCDQLQHTADAEDCKVIYVAKVHTDTKEREYVFNVVSKTSGYTPYAIGYRDSASEGVLNAYNSILNGESEIQNLMYSKQGYTTSVYPVKDSGGSVVAIVGVVKDMTLLNNAKSQYILQILLIEAAIAIVSGVIWVIYMRHRIVKPIRQLSEATLNMVEHLEDGTSPKIIVKKDDEIKDLADCFSEMYGEIGEYISELKTITAEKERIGAELDVAAKIQSSILPCVFPPYPNRKEFEIFASMNAAKEVGGDFYDFYMLGKEHLALTVADVSGKGIPAAMFMMRAKTLIKSFVESGYTVDEAFVRTNESLCDNNTASMFVTAWFGVLNLTNGELAFVNAGHNPPLLKRADGQFEYLRVKPNFVLAGMEGARYRRNTLTLNPGDSLFIYTDGVTEAMTRDGCLYGEERLKQTLNLNSEKSCEELCKATLESIISYADGAPQSDDITMLSLKFNYRKNGEWIEMNPDRSSIETAHANAEKFVGENNIPPSVANKLYIAIDEIYSNIVYYSGASKAEMQIGLSDGKVTLIFKDNGKPFNPLNAPEPDITKSSDEREIGGLGIFMVKKTCLTLDYCYENGNNVVTVVYKI